ncbi:phosphoenolpyruvate--protein phosphotransferase, partial [Listeria monocytogenes]|nr:phosphoenolpyruvate--protein phosphotransferase [Listeria monocytogenes]
RAEQLLAEVDFVSLGTNDLAQYTMATDRLRGELADLLDPWPPAVLDLVAVTARAGGTLGKPVGVCGESAADPLMALVLVG